MTRTIWATLSAVVLASALSINAQPARKDYCSPQPPPQGLVARCQSRVIVVPDNPMAFRLELSGWMNTCVSSDRGVALVHQAESVDKIWELMKSHPGKTVKVTPQYEPLKFTQEGKTCYGVKSVEFRVPIPKGIVGIDEPISIEEGPTDDMIKSAATAAKRALASPSVKGSAELSRFLGVLEGLERYGKDFDDTYYPVAPQLGGLDAYACFKDYTVSTGGFSCLPPDKAKRACARHLAQEIVSSVHYDNVSPARLAEILEIKANDIQRGVTYLLSIQAAETGLLICPGLRDAIKPAIGELSKKGKTTVYGYY